jgi:curved DNA-binding protein CbpA
LHDIEWPPLTSPRLVHSAFRSQSLLCHPDKHPQHAGEAERAWDKLKAAHDVLSSHDSALTYATAYLDRLGRTAEGKGGELDVGGVVEVEREKERLRKKKADAFHSRLTASLTKRKEREAVEKQEEEVERTIWGADKQQRVQPTPESSGGEGEEADVLRGVTRSLQSKKKRQRAGAF